MFLKTLEGSYVNASFIVRVYIWEFMPDNKYTVYADVLIGDDTHSYELYKSNSKEDCEKFIENTFLNKSKVILG